jgi:type IV pilus assembly protein PilP
MMPRKVAQNTEKSIWGVIRPKRALTRSITPNANLPYCLTFTYSLFNYTALLIFPVFSVMAKTGEAKQENQDENLIPDETVEAEVKERKYLYDPTGKTDPFKPFINPQAQQREKEDEEPRTYLETLELSQLNISVIIIGKKDKWAMVTDNKGEGHLIKEGTSMGINRGKVYKIKPGEVIIREEYRNTLTGEMEFRDVSKKTQSD